ncbi:MAG: SDR family oxidoreductase [Clostridia bacterium]|nr:SDR family oxidoreductase [Clostridia bacterium]
MDMKNKTVLITGASGGIGRAMALAFAEEGYAIAVHYNKGRESAMETAQQITDAGGRTVAVCADLTCYEQVSAMLDDIRIVLGDVDVLINNAGIADIRPFASVAPDVWRTMMDTNLTAVYNCCHAVLPMMLRREGGSIVNVSSVWGLYGASCEVHYSAAKSGVIGLTQALAKELGASGIRVNCIAPGVIDTAMNASLGAEELAELAEQTPLGRIGKPEEVAQAALFLASDRASFITGAVLPVTGCFC